MMLSKHFISDSDTAIAPQKRGKHLRIPQAIPAYLAKPKNCYRFSSDNENLILTILHN